MDSLEKKFNARHGNHAPHSLEIVRRGQFSFWEKQKVESRKQKWKQACVAVSCASVDDDFEMPIHRLYSATHFTRK
jgi:hypothetical protein